MIKKKGVHKQIQRKENAMVAKKHVETTEIVQEESPSPLTIVARLIYFVFGVIISIILLRMLLLLLAANRGNGFVDFIYDLSSLFVAPFFNMFQYEPSYGASVFELSSLFAVFIYALIMWLLVSLLMLGSRQRSDEV